MQLPLPTLGGPDGEMWAQSRIDTRQRILMYRLRWLESSERRVRKQLTELTGVNWTQP